MMKKKYFLYSFIVVLMALTHYFLYKSDITKIFDYKVYDFMSSTISKDATDSSRVVVIDIDDKSLNVLGQWPWPRVLMSEIIDKIDSYNPSAIGLDLIFPEKDRTSPLEINSFYKRYYNIDVKVSGLPDVLQDNDDIFAQSLKRSNSVTSVYLSNVKVSNNSCESMPSLKLELKDFSLQEINDFLGAEEDDYAEELEVVLRLMKQAMNLGSVMKLKLSDEAKCLLKSDSLKLRISITEISI